MSDKPATRQFDDFDEFAQDYEAIHNRNIRLSGAKSDELNKERIEIIRRQEPTEPSTIVDFGCGPGATQVFLRELFPKSKLIGIDPSKDSMEEGNKRKIPNCTFIPFDGETWPLENASADIAIMANVLHHISFDLHNKVMSEARRVLKPGGRLYIFEHNPLNPVTLHFINTCPFDHDAVLLHAPYARKLVLRAGFEKVRVKFFIFLPRFAIFKPLVWLERLFFWFPLGGKYYVRAINR